MEFHKRRKLFWFSKITGMSMDSVHSTYMQGKKHPCISMWNISNACFAMYHHSSCLDGNMWESLIILNTGIFFSDENNKSRDFYRKSGKQSKGNCTKFEQNWNRESYPWDVIPAFFRATSEPFPRIQVLKMEGLLKLRLLHPDMSCNSSWLSERQMGHYESWHSGRQPNSNSIPAWKCSSAGAPGVGQDLYLLEVSLG